MLRCCDNTNPISLEYILCLRHRQRWSVPDHPSGHLLTPPPQLDDAFLTFYLNICLYKIHLIAARRDESHTRPLYFASPLMQRTRSLSFRRGLLIKRIYTYSTHFSNGHRRLF